MTLHAFQFLIVAVLAVGAMARPQADEDAPFDVSS
jgi:hypothetical protein